MAEILGFESRFVAEGFSSIDVGGGCSEAFGLVAGFAIEGSSVLIDGDSVASFGMLDVVFAP